MSIFRHKIEGVLILKNQELKERGGYMKLKLFYEDIKGYVVSEENIRNLKIQKIDRKNYLQIRYTNDTEDYIELKELKLVYLIDVETMYEFFRYEK